MEIEPKTIRMRKEVAQALEGIKAEMGGSLGAVIELLLRDHLNVLRASSEDEKITAEKRISEGGPAYILASYEQRIAACKRKIAQADAWAALAFPLSEEEKINSIPMGEGEAF